MIASSQGRQRESGHLTRGLGRCAGIVEASRHTKEVEGAWTIPVMVIADGFADVAEHSILEHWLGHSAGFDFSPGTGEG